MNILFTVIFVSSTTLSCAYVVLIIPCISKPWLAEVYVFIALEQSDGNELDDKYRVN